MQEHSIKLKQERLKDELKHAIPARKLTKSRQGVQLVQFPSIKNARTINCESSIESDFALLLEYDDNVVGYKAQPHTYTLFGTEGNQIKYTPDFEVFYKNSPPRLFEIKPDPWKLDPQLVDKLQFIINYFHNEGIELEVVSASQIRKQPLISNLRKIYSQIHAVNDSSYKHLESELRLRSGKSTIAELNSLTPQPCQFSIMKMLFNGPTANIDSFPLSQTTVVELR